jgi:hypothetical protein
MKKLILLIMLIIFISGCLEKPYDPHQKEFGGYTLSFRADLDEAEKVSVQPNETTLRDVILNNDVEEIGIAYIPNESENAFYLAASYELAYKLTIINKHYFNMVKSIDSIPVNSSLEALSISTSQKPVIMLIGPSKTNSTLVNVAGYLITAQGKSFEETNRTYNELDLAVDKILLVLMKEVNI